LTFKQSITLIISEAYTVVNLQDPVSREQPSKEVGEDVDLLYPRRRAPTEERQSHVRVLDLDGILMLFNVLLS